MPDDSPRKRAPRSALGNWYRSRREDALGEAADNHELRLRTSAKQSGRIAQTQIVRDIRGREMAYTYSRPDPTYEAPVERERFDADSPPTESSRATPCCSRIANTKPRGQAPAQRRISRLAHEAARPPTCRANHDAAPAPCQRLRDAARVRGTPRRSRCLLAATDCGEADRRGRRRRFRRRCLRPQRAW